MKLRSGLFVFVLAFQIILVSCTAHRVVAVKQPVHSGNRVDYSDFSLKVNRFSIGNFAHNDRYSKIEKLRGQFIDYLRTSCEFQNIYDSKDEVDPKDLPNLLEVDVYIDLDMTKYRTYLLDYYAITTLTLFPLVPIWGKTSVVMTVDLHSPSSDYSEAYTYDENKGYIVWFYSFYRKGGIEDAFSSAYQNVFRDFTVDLQRNRDQIVDSFQKGRPEADRFASTKDEKITIEDKPDISDIDINIPQARKTNPDAVAVVIGNCNYSNYHTDVPDVDFAINDAESVKNYLINTLGYQEGNILYHTDARFTDFRGIFGTESQPEGKLSYTIKPGVSDVFIYYNGHGAPDVKDESGYLVPVDCQPMDVSLNGYPLDLFYENISQLDAKSLTIVIDACFSGGSASGKMLIGSASPLGIRIKNPALAVQNSSIFNSSSGEEISSWYPEKKHSLFTYFFLKGIQGSADKNGDKLISSGELNRYVSDKTNGVPYWARRLFNGRRQTPVFYGDDETIIRGKVKR